MRRVARIASASFPRFSRRFSGVGLFSIRFVGPPRFAVAAPIVLGAILAARAGVARTSAVVKRNAATPARRFKNALPRSACRFRLAAARHISAAHSGLLFAERLQPLARPRRAPLPLRRLEPHAELL